jgi:hypothetical protein
VNSKAYPQKTSSSWLDVASMSSRKKAMKKDKRLLREPADA